MCTGRTEENCFSLLTNDTDGKRLFVLALVGVLLGFLERDQAGSIRLKFVSLFLPQNKNRNLEISGAFKVKPKDARAIFAVFLFKRQGTWSSQINLYLKTP